MYALAIDRLTGAGFEHYEVSNFAQPGCRSRHNETYWSGDGYFAAGPGAARYVNGIREMNHRSTTTYLRRVLAGESPVAERERLSPEARARELLVFGLRRMDGVSRREFAERTGFEVGDLVAGPLERFVELGLLNDTGERVRLTREGLFVSDAIWPEML
jgi:oxygen-independent coproporphyrinogen-3 oxidase